MAAYLKLANGHQAPIDPKELVTKAIADQVAAELGQAFPGMEYSVQPYADTNPNEEIVYDSAQQIFQIMPGYQDAAQLFYAQQANPKGRGWTGTPLTAAWDPFPSPPGPVVPPAAGPSPDIMAIASGPAVALYAHILGDLAAIRAALKI